MSHQSAPARQAVSPWASGPITFAAAMTATLYSWLLTPLEDAH